MNRNIIVCLLSILLVSCISYEPVTFYNNTDHDIGYYIGMGGGDGTVYPDTLLPNGYSHAGVYRNSDITINVEGTWAEWYGYLKTDTLCFFILNSDTLNKYPWEEIRKDYKILRRYDLSLQDLEYLEYKIYYPPTPKMRDIKMYPPYGVDME